MDNMEVTKKIIFEKLCESIHAFEKGSAYEGEALSDMKNELDKAYFYLNKLIEKQNISSINPVLTRRKGILGKVVAFVKKIIRKIIFWYIEPICKDQTNYNEMCTQFAIQMFYYAQRMEKQKNEELIIRLEEVEKESKEGKELYQNLNTQVDDLTQNVFEITQKYNELAYMSVETKQVIEDMQIIKRENEEMFRPCSEDFWNKITVAQSGEDSIIAYVLMVLGINISKEYYLDLGANHAKQLSNTYMLYKKGMRGVLLEANPELIGELKFYRGEDVILNKCIADKTGVQVPFYILSGDGLSSMDIDSVHEVMEKNPQVFIKEQINIETITIGDILEKYFDKAPLILNVDIEGMEEKILKSIDYSRFAPLIILVERIDYSVTIATDKREDGIADIMNQNDYFEYAFTGINSIFINKKKLEEIRNK